MKLKEVCTETGLTPKTIRFYEENSTPAQIISPKTAAAIGIILKKM